ncbi:MAG: 2-phosphosulfolactate phosphatase [Planctomycetia bacterium]|nr:2-phosphosulfolactate phosphatase [Planctomycetia bacterium]
MPSLHVHLLPDLVPPAALAGRAVVVIDVLRATTTICHALAAGALAVVPCLEIDEARAKADALGRSDVVLGGERRGLKIEGFDLGNAPTEYTRAVVGGRTVVFTTTNGTRAMRHAGQAAEILIGAFANLSAVVDALAAQEHIDLLCAGTGGAITAEDALFAGAVVARLTRGASDYALNDQARLARDAWRSVEASGMALAGVLRECQGGRNLIAEGFDADIDTAAKIDTFDFVPRLDLRSGTITLR